MVREAFVMEDDKREPEEMGTGGKGGVGRGEVGGGRFGACMSGWTW